MGTFSIIPLESAMRNKASPLRDLETGKVDGNHRHFHRLGVQKNIDAGQDVSTPTKSCFAVLKLRSAIAVCNILYMYVTPSEIVMCCHTPNRIRYV